VVEADGSAAGDAAYRRRHRRPPRSPRDHATDLSRWPQAGGGSAELGCARFPCVLFRSEPHTGRA